MNKKELAHVNMYDVVHKICRNDYAVLSSYAPFVTVFAEFENKLTELRGWAIKQIANPEGITIDKNKRRKWLENDALKLSSILYAFATLSDQVELLRKAKYTATGLSRAGEKELAGICHKLLNDANDNLTGLAPYMIDAAWLTAFEAKINDFLGYVGAPANARADIKIATTQINRLDREISDWLRNCLDPLMYQFKDQDTLLYAYYKNARKIVDAGSHPPALKGCVKDKDGNALKGLMVRIDGTVRKSLTTVKGNFVFKSMKTGIYTLIVFDKKKELKRLEVGVPFKGILEIEIGEG